MWASGRRREGSCYQCWMSATNWCLTKRQTFCTASQTGKCVSCVEITTVLSNGTFKNVISDLAYPIKGAKRWEFEYSRTSGSMRPTGTFTLGRSQTTTSSLPTALLFLHTNLWPWRLCRGRSFQRYVSISTGERKDVLWDP